MGEEEYQAQYKQELEKIKELKGKNKDLILDFEKRYPKSTPNKSVGVLRRIKYLQVLRKCNDYLDSKALNTLCEKDLEKIMDSIQGHKENPSTQTYNTYSNILKVWLRWNQGETYPLLKSKYLKRSKRDRTQDIDPDMLPTEEDTLALIKAAENNQDWELVFMFAIMGGCGPRPDSVHAMYKKNMHWLEDGAVTLNLFTKTGRHEIKVHAGYACFCKKWFEQRTDPEAKLLVSKKPALTKRKNILKHKLGIKKPLRWYDFRRRHCIWCMENLPPVIARMRMWNNPDSTMDAIYHKVSNKTVAEAYDRAMGGAPVKKESKFKGITCWKCHKELKPGTDICPDCNIEPDAGKYFDATTNAVAELIDLKLETFKKDFEIKLLKQGKKGKAK